MPQKKQPLQKLELTWIGKGTEPKLEPRILISDPEHSYGNNQKENLLIHGDNLLALKALEQEYTGKVKCIYIDPPYNTGNAFEHYDDGLEHSIWLNLLQARLSLLWKLLAIDGTLWISIDDSEMPYLRVLMDELVGRSSFIASNIWQKRYSRENRGAIGDVHEYILVYAKDPDSFKKNRNLLPLTEEQEKIYKNPNNDPNGRWRGIPMTAQGYRPNQMYEIVSPGGKKHSPPDGRCWSMIESEFRRLENTNRIWYGNDGNSQPNVIRYLTEVEGLVPWTLWLSNEVGHTDESKKEILSLFGKDKIFDTPKPERLIQRIIHIATNPGDLVLDSFLGSGTTAAVAHKMGRRWIGIELGEHAVTHCVPRLKKVIDGEDSGGITKAVDWSGGGGYTFYRLAPSLLNLDGHGNYIISKEYNPDMLAAAMAKHEGFRYNPDPAIYWKQGSTTGLDFIFTTTQLVTVQMIESIQEEMKPGETLLICCKTFQKECKGKFSNITIKKIPQVLIGKCEFGKEDYSLNIIESPRLESDQDDQDITELSVQEIPKKTRKAKEQRSLFDL